MSQDGHGLIFLLGDELPETLRIQARLLAAGIRNPVFAMADLHVARAQLLELAHSAEWFRCLDPHLMVLSLRKEAAAIAFLRWLRADSAFSRVLAVALADRAEPYALQRALDAGANSYQYRDAEHGELAELLRNPRFTRTSSRVSVSVN